MTFDKAGWAAERGNYDGESKRGAMVSGIDDAGVRVGATRDQVRSVLGDPDSTGPAADIYYLGRSRSGPSFETFRVDYSTAGVVTATGVRRS
ncbi:outer membrane protein assembly factor BamE [Sphingomonas sp. SUN019]|uniref:outer membrane protein assembly factor BamE n=1 Tax=Sphingomonas sp. SUN019 TaxID=2937788 RepID=UPI002164843B|nr:outer membrane protein assembly factor BamE [Sphingomonas sp. SUN019]UVO49620.1 outer membrane protein assembly factor BamE [Sphingomonas sp. SUN019]